MTMAGFIPGSMAGDFFSLSDSSWVVPCRVIYFEVRLGWFILRFVFERSFGREVQIWVVHDIVIQFRGEWSCNTTDEFPFVSDCRRYRNAHMQPFHGKSRMLRICMTNRSRNTCRITETGNQHEEEVWEYMQKIIIVKSAWQIARETHAELQKPGIRMKWRWGNTCRKS